MNPDTGAILDHYQAIAGDIFSPDNPLGADVDFGAAPNLFDSPTGKPLVGEGAKDGKYYAADRAGMNKQWATANGPGAPTGGIVGATAFDGAHIFSTNVLTSQVMAMTRGGGVAWTSMDGGSADWSPVATANGAVYTLAPGGNLVIRHAQSGTQLKSLSLGSQTLGGAATTGRAVYVAVGTGPLPGTPPGSEFKGAIVAFGDTSKSGANSPGGRGGGGSGGYNVPKGKSKCRVRRPRGARMRLRVRPRRVRVGHRRKFRFRVTCKGRPVRRAIVRFAGHRSRSSRRGRV